MFDVVILKVYETYGTVQEFIWPKVQGSTRYSETNHVHGNAACSAATARFYWQLQSFNAPCKERRVRKRLSYSMHTGETNIAANAARNVMYSNKLKAEKVSLKGVRK